MEAWSCSIRVSPRSEVKLQHLRPHSECSTLRPSRAAKHAFRGNTDPCSASGGDETIRKPASAPGSSRKKPTASQRLVPLSMGASPSKMRMPNKPTGSRRSKDLSKKELDDQFELIFETINNRESDRTTRQPPECRSKRSMSTCNRSATRRALFTESLMAQEEFRDQVMAEAATRRALKVDWAQGGGGLRSILDQELDFYDPNTSVLDTSDVMSRVMAMTKVLKNVADN